MVAAAGMLALAGCNNEDVIRTDVDAGSITIQATIGQMTKVTYSGTSGSFEAGDCISVYGWTGSADSVPAIREVNNVKNRLAEDGKWNAESRMVWNSTTDKYYFLGIYPVRKVTNFKADDYTLYPADSTASDLLIATNLTGVKAADGPVELEFRHALAKLTVNLKIRNEFGATPAMATVAANAKVTATVNYLTGKLTPTGSAQAVSLTALTRVADGYMQSFSGLQVPQDIRIITVTIGGRMYKYEAATDISLCAGKHTTLGLIVGKDRIELEGATVAEWATGTDLAGGVADLVDPYNGHAYVDLGLPSGLKWATCNVGASKPEEYGDYFAWGDTVPYYEPGHAQDDLQTYGKDDKKKTDGYDWSTYKWC